MIVCMTKQKKIQTEKNKRHSGTEKKVAGMLYPHNENDFPMPMTT